MRILIAEDDTVSRTILQRSLEKFGHEGLVAEDGESAWELYKENSDLNVIISDWMMPGMDGLELCRMVRGDPRDTYTYFIFLTALGDKQHLLRGLETGADDYLSKPLDRDELQVRLISASRVTALHRRLAELNRLLFQQSRQDPLTRLGNRLRLREDLETLSAQTKRYGGRGCCAMLCDVDSFKAYNDTHGHLAGDEVLERVANAILWNLRAGDTAYRYGGEEFLVILPDQDLESASVAAERLRCGVEELAIPHESRTPPGAVVTVSVGLAALTPGEKKTLEDLLKEADAALYRAKEGGKNGVALYGIRP
ncbi:MAG: diguanylate cyclase [Rubrobacteraceae bacterium]|nr:diguanylate cyclase [Rubrobacteraceae bacterium]